MALTAHGDIAIAQLVIFGPCWPLALTLCIRHGFGRSSGWIFILLLCTIRIAGAACELVAEHHPTATVIKATLVFDLMGIAPLLLATLGMLLRFVEHITASVSNPMKSRYFRIIQIAIAVALILGIVGISSGSSWSPDGTFKPSSLSKAGVIIYVVAWCAITVIFALSLSTVSALPKTERPLLGGLPVALFALAIRLLYAVLCVFVDNNTFALFGGSILANILMAVVEEFIVVIVVLIVGFTLKREDRGTHGDVGQGVGAAKSYGQRSKPGFEVAEST